MMRSLLVGFAATFALYLPAQAFVTIVTTPSGQPLVGEGMITARTGVQEERFNNSTSTSTCVPPGGLGLDLVGVQGDTYDLANDSVWHRRKAPALDSSCYLTVGAARKKDSLELDFAGASSATPLTYFGLYWGSIDEYNHIAFFNANGAVDFSGSLGQQLDGNTIASLMGVPLYSSNFVEFNLDPADHVTYAIISSDNYAFELDNLAYTLAAVTPNLAAVPEAASAGVIAMGTLMVAFGRRRRR
jgi:hypothetical protein